MQMDMSGPSRRGYPFVSHAYALKPPIPVTLDPKQFPDALSRNVYALAAKIKPVLYQQPCYCYCDRHAGHKSLLDCFAGTHGSECDICQKEAIFAYQQTQKGKTPSQIRAAIIRWRLEIGGHAALYADNCDSLIIPTRSVSSLSFILQSVSFALCIPNIQNCASLARGLTTLMSPRCILSDSGNEKWKFRMKGSTLRTR